MDPATGGALFKIATADEFSYTDPITSEVAEHQGVRLLAEVRSPLCRSGPVGSDFLARRVCQGKLSMGIDLSGQPIPQWFPCTTTWSVATSCT